jgi:hypothetical protein
MRADAAGDESPIPKLLAGSPAAGRHGDEINIETRVIIVQPMGARWKEAKGGM